MIRIGINGFGRIGRAVARIAFARDDLEVVCVNDIDPNLENLAYLLRFDSTYGRFDETVEVGDGHLIIGGAKIRFHASPEIEGVNWGQSGVDVVVDASGVKRNVAHARDALKRGPRRVVVTHAPDPNLVDQTLILGANEDDWDPERHRVVAASICDANALAPTLSMLQARFGVGTGYVLTLHPWLSYQNLVDGPVRSIASPGHFWTDFSLGRASTENLIPKETSALRAVGAVLPEVAARLSAMSFRVPTSIVSAAQLCVQLDSKPSADDVNAVFLDAAARQPRVVAVESQPLVSLDYRGAEQSLTLDARWTEVDASGIARLLVWYDNEWGYSNRVVDLVERIGAEA